MNPGDSRQDDRDLVTQTLKNRQAFAFIVEKYVEPLRRYIRRLGCTDPHDVEDILQELFIKCYVNLNDYDATLKFSSWLYRIAHNETMTHFRKKKVRPMPALSDEDLAALENMPDTEHSAEAAMEKSDSEHLRKALENVNEKYRDALLLRFFEEKSYTEISDILRIPEGTVATYINRGKKELKSLLTQKNV